ncbi:aldo/keto reductase [Ancylobacter sp. VKM B-3255]|uniref:Aldo/keto reductase n=1 Tax=Ancylobacter radicis TaxID=2836179 RepID=A0ABS5RAL9_9HYPH|nr:aldo/keto reductase [Ancylobacter radicis]
MGFGTYLIHQDVSASAVRAAIEKGYRHIDTAQVYQNEKGVGEGIRAGIAACGLSRDDIFVTTKLWPGNAAWGEQPKNRQQALAAFAESLDLLGLDDVDLYLIHSPHGGTQRLAQWQALLDLKQDGRARSIGVSNFNIKHIEQIAEAGLALPEANQIELHPWSQKPALLAFMAQHGIAPIAYSSLAPLSTWRVDPGQDSAKTGETASDAGIFGKLAAKYGVSEAQLLLRWGVQSGYAVLPKSLNPERMRENINLGGFEIDNSDMALLRTLDRGDGLAWSVGDPTLID